MGTIDIPVCAADQIRWHSYEEGRALARTENKKLFINFHADWCTFCRTMDQKTFVDTGIIAYLNTNFIAVKVNVDREKPIARKYNINPLPDSWFLSETGEAIGNRPGYLSAQDLLPILQFIHTQSYLKMSYRKFKESQ